MLKIAIVGPESSGKTTLAQALAARYNAPWVPEYAREYLSVLGRSYEEIDLINIAAGQLAAEERSSSGKLELLICDTDMITIRIWAQVRFGRVLPVLEELVQQATYDHSLLCSPDIPWEFDPLRENPTDRDRLFAIYREVLQEEQRTFTAIAGTLDERVVLASRVVDDLLLSAS